MAQVEQKRVIVVAGEDAARGRQYGRHEVDRLVRDLETRSTLRSMLAAHGKEI